MWSVTADFCIGTDRQTDSSTVLSVCLWLVAVCLNFTVCLHHLTAPVLAKCGMCTTNLLAPELFFLNF